MVLNKCSMERGLAHGQIYKTEIVDLTLLEGLSGRKIHVGEVSCQKVVGVFFHVFLSSFLTECVCFYISYPSIVRE